MAQAYDHSSETKRSKFIVYVDESGDHSLESVDQNYPVFVLAFCVFYQDNYIKMSFQQSKN